MRLRRMVVACLTGSALIGGASAGWVPARAGLAPPAPTGPQVWPLGDSITYGLSPASAGGTAVSGQTPGGYRADLDSYLNQDGYAHVFVGTMTSNATPVLTDEGENHHDGHPGYRIDQITADLDGVAGEGTDDGGSWMTRSTGAVHPEVTILLLGGNDILQHYDPATTFPTSNGEADYSDPAQVSTFVADMAGRLQTLIGQIETYDPGSAILLCDTPPISQVAAAGQGMVDPVTGDYAQAVQNLAAQEAASGVRIAFVDVWSQFVESTPHGEAVTPGMLGTDGQHPTAAGYQAIAQVLRTPLESLLSGAS